MAHNSLPSCSYLFHGSQPLVDFCSISRGDRGAFCPAGNGEGSRHAAAAAVIFRSRKSIVPASRCMLHPFLSLDSDRSLNGFCQVRQLEAGSVSNLHLESSDASEQACLDRPAAQWVTNGCKRRWRVPQRLLKSACPAKNDANATGNGGRCDDHGMMGCKKCRGRNLSVLVQGRIPREFRESVQHRIFPGSGAVRSHGFEDWG